MTDSKTTESTLLQGARLVLADRVVDRASLLVADGRIQAIYDIGEAIPHRSTHTLDLTGLTLFPGFIDIHIHGAVGIDTMEADADDLHRVAEFLARNGVTAWLPTLVPARIDQYEHAVRAIKDLMRDQESRFAPAALNADQTSARPAGQARALGLHYEGPFINSAQCGALRPEHFRTFKNVADLDDLPGAGNLNAVRMMTLAPEIDGGIELVGELKKRGWIISLGHTRATPKVLDKARDAGAHHMTHFMNAMSPLHQRAPGPVGWGLLNDDVSLDVIADGVHVDPLMLKVLIRCKTPARLALISDAVAAAGLGDGAYKIWGEKISVKDGRTQNTRGSIAGSVITMLDAVRMMLSLGSSESDVARMASLNPARLLGIEQDCGSIEEGKRADLVALDDKGKVQLTLVGGRVAFNALA